MSDETAASAAGSEQVPAQSDDNIIESYGRKFDITKPQERRDLKVWTEALSTSLGKMSNEVGALRKENEPLRKYNLKGSNADEAAIAKQVSELQAQGDYEKATALLFEYSRQVGKDAEVKLEEVRLWNDYVKQNPKIFDVLPEDVMKDYVFKNYRSELMASENPLNLIDTIVKPKASKITPAAEPAVPATLGASQASSSPKVEDTKVKEDESQKGKAAWDDIYKTFNFK